MSAATAVDDGSVDALSAAFDAAAQRTEAEGEQAASDAAADLLAEEVSVGVETTRLAAAVEAPVIPKGAEPLISREDATQRLGPKVLAALQAKFNGSLTDIRYPDENDMLF